MKAKNKKRRIKFKQKNNGLDHKKKRNGDKYSIEELKIEIVKYIEEDGFAIDAKSFGNRSSGSNSLGHESYPVPNEYEYYVLVSIQGFMQYLEKYKNYYYEYLKKIEDNEKRELDTYVRSKLYTHNVKGVSLSHINNSAFTSWERSTFGREEIEQKKKLNQIKIEQEEIRLKQMKSIVESTDSNDIDQIKNNMEMLGNLLNSAK